MVWFCVYLCRRNCFQTSFGVLGKVNSQGQPGRGAAGAFSRALR